MIDWNTSLLSSSNHFHSSSAHFIYPSEFFNHQWYKMSAVLPWKPGTMGTVGSVRLGSSWCPVEKLSGSSNFLLWSCQDSLQQIAHKFQVIFPRT